MPWPLKGVIGALVVTLIGNVGLLAMGLDIDIGPALGNFAGGPIVTIAVHVLLLTGLLKRKEWGRKAALVLFVAEMVWSAIELVYVARQGYGWGGATLPLFNLLYGALAIAALARPAMKQHFFAQEYRSI